MRIRTVCLLVFGVTLALTSACGPATSNKSAPASSAHSNGRPAASPSANAKATPALPGSLPTFSDNDGAAGATQSMLALLQLAEQHAVGIPGEDRNPSVTAVGHNPCHLYIAAGACLPATANQPVPMEINPDEAWSNLYQSSLYRDNDPAKANAAWQSAVLGAYINYLMARESQRTNPQLLTTNDAADGPAIRKLQLCKQGNVLGPLWPAMSPALQSTFQGLQSKPDFVGGTKGEC